MEINRNNQKDHKDAMSPKVLVIMGANTGGPAVLSQIIPKLPRDLEASVVVMQQMRPGFTYLLADCLDDESEIRVTEAGENHVLAAGEVVVVPGNCGAEINVREFMRSERACLELEDLADTPEKYRNRIDRLMQSAVAALGSSVIGIVLTGLGDDGREGLRAIHHVGGKTIAQDEASSILFDMPKAAIEAKVVDEVLPIYGIADRIAQLVRDGYAEFLQEAAG